MPDLRVAAPYSGNCYDESSRWDAAMLRPLVTLALTIGALGLAVTERGSALLGSNRTAIVAALVVLGISQAYRMISAWQAQKRSGRMTKIPKRPLGI